MSRLTLVDSAMSNLMAVLVADNAAMVNLTCAELLLKMAQDLGNSNISGDTVPMIHGSVLLLQKEYPILDAFCLSSVKKKTRLQLYGFHKFGDQRPGSASSFLALSDGELIAWGRGVASDSEEKEILPTREPGDIGSAVPGPLELRDFAVEVK